MNYQNEVREYRLLIEKGEGILSGIQSGNLTIDIHGWIIKVIDHIIPLMLSDISEYQELVRIKGECESSNIIIPGEQYKQVSKVLENLKIACGFFVSFMEGNHEDVPPKNFVDIAYDRLKGFVGIVGTHLLSELKGKEDGKTTRTAMLHTYGRLYCLADGMLRLNQSHDYIAISGVLRAMLELYLDMRLLEQDIIGNGADKFFGFTKVQKYRDATTITKLRKKYRLDVEDKVRPIEKFVKDTPHEDIERERERLWGVDKKGKAMQPSHWTNLNVIERVEKINDESVLKIYLDMYYYCNYHIHSMYMNFPGENLNTVHLFMWNSYSLGGDMFSGSTRIINKKIGVLDEKQLEEQLHVIENRSRELFMCEKAEAGRKSRGQKTAWASELPILRGWAGTE
jgi:hypothetical protein